MTSKTTTNKISSSHLNMMSSINNSSSINKNLTEVGVPTEEEVDKEEEEEVVMANKHTIELKDNTNKPMIMRSPLLPKVKEKKCIIIMDIKHIDMVSKASQENNTIHMIEKVELEEAMK